MSRSPVLVFFIALAALALIAIVTGNLKAAFLREHKLRVDRDQALQNVHELEGLLHVCA